MVDSELGGWLTLIYGGVDIELGGVLDNVNIKLCLTLYSSSVAFISRRAARNYKIGQRETVKDRSFDQKHL